MEHETQHQETLLPITETRRRSEAMGAGRLHIYDTYIDGKPIASVFTLESLAHVMGLPMTTIEGRYQRGNLKAWMVPIMSGAGRPARGFHYAQLQAVIDIIVTRGARVHQSAAGSNMARPKPAAGIGALIPTYFRGQAHFTVPVLAAAFGISETTVRKRLSRVGLLSKFVDLDITMFGRGRPKRGIAKKYLGEVQMVLAESSAVSVGLTHLNRSGQAWSGVLDTAQAAMEAAIVPHEPPVPRSLRAYDNEALKPATTALPQPVNAINSPGDSVGDPDGMDALAAEIETIMARAPAADPVIGVPVTHTMELATEALTEDEEKANRAALREPLLLELLAEAKPAEPAALREATYALAMEKEDAQAFIDEYHARWAAKHAGQTLH